MAAIKASQAAVKSQAAKSPGEQAKTAIPKVVAKKVGEKKKGVQYLFIYLRRSVHSADFSWACGTWDMLS